MLCVVTGGSRGIGRAVSVKMAKCGYTVLFCYKNNSPEAEKTLSLISEAGGRAEALRSDVSREEDVIRLFEEADRLGGLKTLVNCAGISKIGLLQDMSGEEIRSLIDTDLTGTVYCCREAAKRLVRTGGAIVNFSSVWGEAGASCEALYSACKAGVIGLTKALAKELGPAGVRVNCVSPGLIDTDMNRELDKEAIDGFISDTPLLRIGTPEDVAEAVAFLAEEKSSFITGQVLGVNGGYI